MKKLGESRTSGFTESVIREMARLAEQHGAINLAQGYPDFACPDELKFAAIEAVSKDMNQYSITWGAKPLRDAIASRLERDHGWLIDPEREITVTCGATEAMLASLMALLEPGDEVVIFEPHYENYAADTLLADAVPRYVSLRRPDWSFDPDELQAAFNKRTRAIVINTPHNPRSSPGTWCKSGSASSSRRTLISWR